MPTWRGDTTVRLPQSLNRSCQHPLRERPQAQLMPALYRSGRQADALERYQQARRHLVDELGIEPDQRSRSLSAQSWRTTPPFVRTLEP